MSKNIETTEVAVIETGIKSEQLQEFNLSENKVTGLKKMFDPMLDKLQEFEDDYNDIINAYDPDSTDVCSDLVKRAKRLRIDISKVRTLTDAKGKEERAEANRYAKAVIGAVNIVEFASKSKENVLKQIETHAEKIEAERLRVLQEERLLIVSEYGFDEEMDFSGMAQTIFDNFVEGLKSNKLAEEETQRKQDLRISRQTECLNLSEYIANYEAIDLAELSDDAYIAMVDTAKSTKLETEEKERIAKEEAEKEQQRIRDENAKLLAEKNKRSERAKELQPYIVFIRDYDSLISSNDEDYTKEYEEVVKGAKAQWDFEQKEAVRIKEEKEAREAREADEKARQELANKLAQEQREESEKQVREAKQAEELKVKEAELANKLAEEAKLKLKLAEDAEAKRIESIKALAKSSKEITAESIAKTIAEGKTIFVQVISIEQIDGQAGIFIKPSEK